MKNFGYILDEAHQLKLVGMWEYLDWWAKAHEEGHPSPPHVVKQEGVGPVKVSTVFLPSMSFDGRRLFPPFETMVFGPDGEALKKRTYESWEEALKGHEEITLSYKIEIN